MKVQEVMTGAGLVTARPDDTLEIAAQMLLWSDVAHLPVVDDAGAVIGVLSEHDLVGRPLDSSTVVASVMSTPPVVVAPDDDLDEAVAKMVSRRLGCLPVVADGKLVGIMTASDLLTLMLYRPAEAKGGSISSLMRRMVASARAEDRLVDAVARMRKLGIRHLPITDGDGKLVGMLSDRDVRTAVGAPAGALDAAEARARVGALRVADVMTRDPVAVTGETRLAEVTRIFVRSRVGALPVVDDEGRVVGIVSYVDALRALGS